MEKQEFESKWDELVREIGAQVPPEAERREEAVLEASEGPPTAPPRKKQPTATDRPPAERPAADWDSLASDLGLAPPPAAAAPPSPAGEEVRPPDERRPREAADQRERGRRPRRERAERREPAPPSHTRGDGPASAADVASGPPARDKAAPAKPPSAPPAEETDRPSAAVSLWHKIFGSPAEQAAKITDMATSVSEVSAAPAAEDTVDLDSPSAARSLSGEDVELVDRPSRADQQEQDDEDAAADRKRGRSRRRRRGGRGRKSEQRRPDSQQESAERELPDREAMPDDQFDELADTDLDHEPIDELDLPPADSERTGDADDRSTSSRRKAAQRAIPTWDEAIGFIVDANLQSRSQRRPSARSESRGNSSRGRRRRS